MEIFRLGSPSNGFGELLNTALRVLGITTGVGTGGEALAFDDFDNTGPEALDDAEELELDDDDPL